MSTLSNSQIREFLRSPSAPPNPRSNSTINQAYSIEIANKLGRQLDSNISAITDNILDNLPSDAALIYYNTLRSISLTLVNRIDSFIERKQLNILQPCPKSCPGATTPIQKSVTLVKLVEDKLIMTDPILEPEPEPEPTAMAIDPPSSLTPRPTYASMAVATQPPADSPPKLTTIPSQSRPKAQAPKAPVLNPVRLVVRPSQTAFKAKPFAMILINGPAEPFRRLTHALSLSPPTKDVKLLGIHVNRSQNLIVSLPHGTSEATVSNVITVIHSCFSTLIGFPLLITRDVAWTKLMVSSVPSRLNPGAPTYLEEEVRDSFLLNPAIQALSITRPPRWIRNPASITGAHSSFTFSFVDPDGSLGRSLAKSRLFTFGKPVHLKRWTDKPRQTRGANSN